MLDTDVINLTTGDGQRLVLLFSVGHDPLRLTAARLVPHTPVPRQQQTVRFARPLDKPRVERVGHLLRTTLAKRAPRTRQDVERDLEDAIGAVNRQLSGRRSPRTR